MAGPGGSCAWYLPLSDNGANALALDQNVAYWVTRIPYVPGMSLTLKGRYPHARYMSVTAYDPRTKAVSSLYDEQIQPDPGSVNPFVVGASRTATSRAWTVKVAFLQPGQQPSAAANTLSTGFTPRGGTPASDFFLVYRVYLPDRGRDQAGGEPLPAVTVSAPPLPDQPLPACPGGNPPPGTANGAFAGTGGPASLPPDAGTPRPVWHKFYNVPTSAAQSPDSTGRTNFAGQVTPYTMKTGSGGYLEDLENAYLYSFLNQGGGPLTVINAKAMSYPDTFGGASTMPGPSDVRYWSVCTYEPTSQRNLACAADFQAAPQSGDYTVVISTPADKPAQLCGATWLPFGPDLQSLAIVRNQLGTAPYTIQNVQLGHETAMGAYYPTARYMDQAAYRQQVCGATDLAGAGSNGSTPGGSTVPADSSGGGDYGSTAGYDTSGYDGGAYGEFGITPGDLGAAADAGATPPDTAATDQPPAGASDDGMGQAPPSSGVLAAHAARPHLQNPALAAALGALLLGVLGVAVRRRLLAA